MRAYTLAVEAAVVKDASYHSCRVEVAIYLWPSREAWYGISLPDAFCYAVADEIKEADNSKRTKCVIPETADCAKAYVVFSNEFWGDNKDASIKHASQDAVSRLNELFRGGTKLD